jgi:hypothetical protein
MKNLRRYRKTKKGEWRLKWTGTLGDDEMLEIDNLPEPDGPDFDHQIDNHLWQFFGEPEIQRKAKGV